LVTEKNGLKKRSLYIYLPSTQIAEEWKNLAGKQGTSVSQFVVEHVFDSLNKEMDSSHVSRADLATRLREKEEELNNVRQERNLFKQLSEKLDNELKIYTMRPFLRSDIQGSKDHNRKLVALLKSQSSVENQTILNELGIDPKETDLVKAIKSELDNLVSYGFVEPTARGWRWVGTSRIPPAN